MNSSSWDVAIQQGKQWKEGKLLPPLAQPTGKVKEAICGFLHKQAASCLETSFRLGLEFRFHTSRRCDWQRNRINGRRLGTARPFPLWRLHSGPQSSSVDQYS